jgi:hypothetical protein
MKMTDKTDCLQLSACRLSATNTRHSDRTGPWPPSETTRLAGESPGVSSHPAGGRRRQGRRLGQGPRLTLRRLLHHTHPSSPRSPVPHHQQQHPPRPSPTVCRDRAASFSRSCADHHQVHPQPRREPPVGVLAIVHETLFIISWTLLLHAVLAAEGVTHGIVRPEPPCYVAEDSANEGAVVAVVAAWDCQSGCSLLEEAPLVHKPRSRRMV